MIASGALRALRDVRESRFKPNRDDYARAGIFGFGSGGRQTNAGPQIGPTTALAEATVYTCVKILCEDISSLPLIMYERDQEDPRKKERAFEHPLYWLAKQQANSETTAQEFLDFQVASLLLRGNALAAIQRDEAGRRVGLWPLRWDFVEIRRNETTHELEFVYRPSRMEPFTLQRREVWMIRGPVSLDGITGLSVIAAQKESIGEAVAQQEFNARFYSNGAAPVGVLKTPNGLSDTAYERVTTSWSQIQAGLSNAHKAAILEEGLEWEPMGINPDDAQSLETRKYSRSTIAGFFRIPAPLVNDQDRSTMNNSEELIRSYVKFSVTPWTERFAQTAHRDLLRPGEKRRYEFEMMLDGLLRGDSEARTKSYWRGIMGGWLTPNEARLKENLPPSDDPRADELLSPLNMQSLSDSAPGTSSPAGAQ